ncbi:NAD-dependent epimerase/dehydratase family protein [Halobacillus litoralis]|uniref:NAD-dependent epimerase/dehydratase family protein n=1 Tax=Halobacillus litoralis TaxID=45668 RepID=UPI002492FD23|nr:NAD-dependent epimerase/dehydratase family protein [Halobacillus litoralis]
MKLLVIGGTQFVGKPIVQHALNNGHEVTLFNRGKTNPHAFEQVETIIGDRENAEDLQKMAGRKWDAVIDTCGFLPGVVAKTLHVLQDNIDLYCFISSVSVYEHFGEADGIDESGEVLKLTQTELERVTEGVKGRSSNEYYGPLKFHSESSVKEMVGAERSLIIRPGLIVGPDDPTDRFTYWPGRVATGGEFIVPEPRSSKVQFIDVRDLSRWIINMVENKESGVYNAAGPEKKLSMEAFVDACRSVLNPYDAKPVWLSQETLLNEKVQPWIELPLWIPAKHDIGIDSTKAIGKGLNFRAIEQTILDTYKWDTSRGSVDKKAGLDLVREEEILENVKKERMI